MLRFIIRLKAFGTEAERKQLIESILQIVFGRFSGQYYHRVLISKVPHNLSAGAARYAVLYALSVCAAYYCDCEQLSLALSYRMEDSVPFGAAEDEFDNPEPGEVVYVSGHEVRTRRWTWRQSEVGKMTEKTTGVLYPIDGFSDLNLEEVKKAMKDFTELVANYFAQSGRSCTVATGIVDRDHPRFEF